MGEWKECKLGDITSKIGSGATPTGGENAYKSNGIALIRSQNVYDFKFSNDGLAYIDEKQAYELRNVEVFENDILINITGESVTRCCIVPKQVLPARVNQHVSIIRPIKEKADFRFVFYYLQSIKPELNSMAEIGCTRRALTKAMLENLEINLPSIYEQRAIASVLSSLDDKIDLLHRQNKTLESMAETLFRQWFVEEADEGWEEKVITELFEIRDGTHDSPKPKDFGKPLITSKHILDNKLDIENAYLISDEDFDDVNQRSKVDTNDILFSMIGTLGRLYLEYSTEIHYAIKNIGLFKTSQNPRWVYYTFLWLKSSYGRDFIHEHRSGSTQEYISLGSLRSIVFNVPPFDLLDKFNMIVGPLFEKRKNNCNQINALEKLRDTLLPKLMSGEVRVNF